MKCWRIKEDGTLCENEGPLTTANGFPVCEECRGKIKEYKDPKFVISLQQKGTTIKTTES
ncbi:MAG: hypothetical protein AABW87_02490 [Nanoarchaeota archaeon]